MLLKETTVKPFNESVAKTIANFNMLPPHVVRQCLEIHTDQWMEQEENWTAEETQKNKLLYDEFIALVEKNCPLALGGAYEYS